MLVWCYGVNDGNCCWSISSTLSVVCSATVLYLLLYNNISHILYQHDLLCTVYLYIESDGTLLCSDVMCSFYYLVWQKENSLNIYKPLWKQNAFTFFSCCNTTSFWNRTLFICFLRGSWNSTIWDHKDRLFVPRFAFFLILIDVHFVFNLIWHVPLFAYLLHNISHYCH